MSAVPTGTVTFLFTDIEGSTKLAQEYHFVWESLRARHHAILNQAVQAHDGHVFQIVGDEFCVAFHTALDAVLAAAEAQRMLFTEPWKPAPIKVRMGIHTGTALAEHDTDRSGGYTGYTTLARTARLMSAGHGGQVLVSLATEELIRDELPGDLGLRDLGSRRLKDLIRPEQIFQLIVPGLPAEFSPLKTLDAYRNNLPVQLTTFIGREKEMMEVKSAINKHSLVTLTGAGGVGKTRLALQVAAELLDKFAEGVWLVELAYLTDPELIPQTILSAFQVPEQKGLTSLQLLLDFLRERHLLLILDNCEHIIGACARLVDTILKHSEKLKILVTTREPLGVAGETDWLVPTLSLPETTQPLTLNQISQYEAVQLFIDRAVLTQPHFTVTRENAPTIAQICHQLDGIPLAIELAAARVRSLNVDDIASRLDDRFRLLTGGSRTSLPRQQTLRATIDWSYDLLTHHEKSLLCRLTVFVGGWTLEAAEQVCIDGEDGVDILELLTHLVEKSLVVMEDSGGHSRFHLLETTRQYASEKLFDSAEGSCLRDNHLAYFLRLAERAEKNIHGPEQVKWVARLESDHDNLRAGLEWSISTEKTEYSLRLLSALTWAWGLRGHYSEMHNWFERVENLPGVKDYPLQYATLLQQIGFHDWNLDNTREARFLLEESRAILLRLGASGERGFARATMLLGMVAFAETDYDTARSLLDQSLALFRKHADRRGEAEGLLNLAFVIANQSHDYSLAIFQLEHSLVIFKQLGNIYGVGRVVHFLGALFMAQGEYEKAESYFKQQIEIDENLQHKVGLINAFIGLGELYRHGGALDRAEQFYKKFLALAHECGLNTYVAYYYYCAGKVAIQRNLYSRALGLFKDQIKIIRQYGMPIGNYDFFLLATLAAGTDQPAYAAKLLGIHQASSNLSLDANEFDFQIQKARSQLGEIKFDAFVNEGRALTPDQAVELAGKVVEKTWNEEEAGIANTFPGSDRRDSTTPR